MPHECWSCSRDLLEQEALRRKILWQLCWKRALLTIPCRSSRSSSFKRLLCFVAQVANNHFWNHLQLALDGICNLAGAFGKRCLRGSVLSTSTFERWPLRSVGLVPIN